MRHKILLGTDIDDALTLAFPGTAVDLLRETILRQPAPDGPHEIAVSVDAAGFLAKVMGHLTTPGESSAWMR